jgi:hypothetical protein
VLLSEDEWLTLLIQQNSQTYQFRDDKKQAGLLYFDCNCVDSSILAFTPRGNPRSVH